MWQSQPNGMPSNAATDMVACCTTLGDSCCTGMHTASLMRNALGPTVCLGGGWAKPPGHRSSTTNGCKTNT